MTENDQVYSYRTLKELPGVPVGTIASPMMARGWYKLSEDVQCDEEHLLKHPDWFERVLLTVQSPTP